MAQGHETRCVLFTDLVGSTELRVRLGEEAADELRRVHDRLLVDTVSAHAGVVVKGLGDGILATFDAAVDALACAIAIQQEADAHSRRHPDRALVVRAGVSVGDVTVEPDDVFGVPVIEASRLCAAAVGGEILVADLVRSLARGRSVGTFEPMGDLDLRGLPEPVPACRLTWEPAALGAEDGSRPPLPPPLTASVVSYVGRAALRSRLGAAWEAARTEACRLVLLAGEPGIGKTRTAAEAARRAFADGGLVLFGRSDEDLAVPYQPFVDMLDYYTTHVASPVLGRQPGELARLLPQLADRVADLPAPMSSDPRSEEHLLFEATTSWLLELSASIPTVLVLDDLHWATKPTLRLLMHVVRAAADTGGRARLLIVGTYRDTDVDRAHPLSHVLADLRRLPGVERIAVEGLDATEVEQLIEVAAGQRLGEDTRRLAEAVFAETEGNPFFVGEVLRHLVETGAVRREDGAWQVAATGLSVPEGVRDVVGRRLSQLPELSNTLLTTAAVIGAEFDVDLLVLLSDAPEDAMLDALDAAVRARLIEEVDADHYRFAHSLVRATLYEELSATRRRRMHRRVANALEKLSSDDVVALAHHYLEAGPERGDVSRAVQYTLAAARQAQARRALADAESQFRTALDVLEDVEDADPVDRVTALIGLGQCQRDQGEATFRETLLRAAAEAKAAGDVDRLVEAVLENSRGFASVVGRADAERVAVTETALAAVGEAPSAKRALLLAQLATEVVFAGGQGARARALSDEAEAMARALGDPAVLGVVLGRTLNPALAMDRIDRLVARGEEASTLADAAGQPAVAAMARAFWSGALLAQGRRRDARAVLDETLQRITDVAPSIQWGVRTHWLRELLLDGRIAEALAENDRCLELGQSNGEADAVSWWGAVFLMASWQRGDDYSPFIDQVSAFADEYAGLWTWRSAYAMTLAGCGLHAEAKALIDRGMDLQALLDEFFATGAAQLAVAAWDLRDADLAAAVERALRPYRTRWAHAFILSYGPISYPLALCAAVQGRLDDAIEYFAEADDTLRRENCNGLLPRLRIAYAETLLARGDAARAHSVLADVRPVAVQMGAAALVTRIDELLTAAA